MSLYRPEILEHVKNPRNFGELAGTDLVGEVNNKICGDSQRWFLKLSKVNGLSSIVEAVGFTGDGCAISMAAASLLSEKIKGLTLAEVDDFNLNEMQDLFGSAVAKGRQPCLMLPLEALRQAIKNRITS